MFKTNEIVVDFRKSGHTLEEVFTHDQGVETVSKYNHFGTIFHNKLNWANNTEAVVRKGQQQNGDDLGVGGNDREVMVTHL